jgi:hypothetical protein
VGVRERERWGRGGGVRVRARVGIRVSARVEIRVRVRLEIRVRALRRPAELGLG